MSPAKALCKARTKPAMLGMLQGRGCKTPGCSQIPLLSSWVGEAAELLKQGWKSCWESLEPQGEACPLGGAVIGSWKKQSTQTRHWQSCGVSKPIFKEGWNPFLQAKLCITPKGGEPLEGPRSWGAKSQLPQRFLHISFPEAQCCCRQRAVRRSLLPASPREGCSLTDLGNQILAD